MKTPIRFEKFPLPVLKALSINREKERVKRLKLQKHYSVATAHRRWESVQLARGADGWYLAYEGKPQTGPFQTKAMAVLWYVRNGR